MQQQAKNPNTIRRHLAIQDYYRELSNEKKDGVRKWHEQYIVTKVCARFFIAEKTLYDILRIDYSEVDIADPQGNLFDQTTD